jgi:hypothetical protein
MSGSKNKSQVRQGRVDHWERASRAAVNYDGTSATKVDGAEDPIMTITSRPTTRDTPMGKPPRSEPPWGVQNQQVQARNSTVPNFKSITGLVDVISKMTPKKDEDPWHIPEVLIDPTAPRPVSTLKRGGRIPG